MILAHRLLLFFLLTSLPLWSQSQAKPVLSSLVTVVNGAVHDEALPITWSSAPDAEFFSLWVGSSPGANDLYQSGETRATSIEVPSQVPRNRLLFARHHTKVKGSWLYRDSTLFVGSPASLVDPKDKGKLPAAKPEFAWTPVPGAEAYRLTIGSQLGKKNHYSGESTTQARVKVDGLPPNRTLHVRLHTQIAGTWLHRDSTVVILKQARLANPSTNGVIELRATDLLKWEPVENVDRYYLWVGSKPGQSDIYNSGETAGTSASIKNAPWDTPLYARLWTQVEGRWEDYEDVIIQVGNLTRTDKSSNRHTGSPPLLFTSWEFVCL